VVCFNHVKRSLPDSLLHETPSLVVDGTGAPITATDLGGAYDSPCAVTAAGAVLCWGGNFYYGLGQDSGVETDAGRWYSSVPLAVPGITMPGGRISRGAYTQCITDGTHVACWGADYSGICTPDASTTLCVNTDLAPGLVAAGAQLPLVGRVQVGNGAACALDSASQVYCWGSNGLLARGYPDASEPFAPAVVSSVAGLGVTSVEAFEYTTCIADSNQHEQCFGDDYFGSLAQGGDASAVPSTAAPLTVVGLDGGGALFPVVRAVGGGLIGCAILAGSCGPNGPGAIACWGYGDLGQGSSTPSLTQNVPLLLPAPQ
jgi:hypothetical protein